MATDKLKTELNKIVGWIDAFQTLIDRSQLSRLSDYGINTSIINWLANGGQLTQAIDVIQLIYLLIGDRDWETFLMELIKEWLEEEKLDTAEDVIKTAVMGILAELLSCDISPIIPDKLIMGGGCEKVGQVYKESSGEGYTIPLSVLDMFGSLYLSPADKVGKYTYFDVRNEDKIYNEYNINIAADYINGCFKIVSKNDKNENGELVFDENGKKVKEYYFKRRVDDGRYWGSKKKTEKINNENNKEYTIYYHKNDRNTLYYQSKLEKTVTINNTLNPNESKVIKVFSIYDENGKPRSLEQYTAKTYTFNNEQYKITADTAEKLIFEDKQTSLLLLLNEEGVLYCDVPDTLWKVKSTVDVNTLWRSHDFNAFLWYVINRGNPADDTAKYKCVWDNRYTASRKIAKSNAKDTATAKDDSLHRIKSLGDDYYEALKECEVAEYNGDITGVNTVLDLTVNLDNIFETVSINKKYTEQEIQDILAEGINIDDKDIYDALFKEETEEKRPSFLIANKTLGLRKNAYEEVQRKVQEKIDTEATNTGETYYLNLTIQVKNNKGERLEFVNKYKIHQDKELIEWDDIKKSTRLLLPNIDLGELNAYKLPWDLGKLYRVTRIPNKAYNSFKTARPKKKQLAYFEYNPGNGLLEGGIRVLIHPSEYYKVHGLPITINGQTFDKINQYMLVWDYEFLQSIKLFDQKVMLARLIDLLFNAASPVIKVNYSQLVINEMVKHIVDGVISMDDTQVNDCYYSFSNDDFNSMLSKAEKTRRGFASNGYSYKAEDLVNDDVIQGTINGDLTLLPNTMRNVVATGKENEVTGGLDFGNFGQNLWYDFLHKLTYCIVEIFLSPKVMMVLAVNMEYLGIDINSRQSWDNILTIVMKSITETIVKMKDMIINWLITYITNLLTKLMEEVMSILAIEQLRTYWEILSNLVNLVQKFFRLHRPLSVNGTIENITYADIQKPEQSVSTDANNNKC